MRPPLFLSFLAVAAWAVEAGADESCVVDDPAPPAWLASRISTAPEVTLLDGRWRTPVVLTTTVAAEVVPIVDVVGERDKRRAVLAGSTPALLRSNWNGSVSNNPGVDP